MRSRRRPPARLEECGPPGHFENALDASEVTRAAAQPVEVAWNHPGALPYGTGSEISSRRGPMTRVIRSLSAFAMIITLLLVMPAIVRGAKTTALSATIANPPGSFVIGDGLGPYPAVFSAGYFQLGLTTGRSLVVNFEDCELDCTAPFAGTSINVYNDSQPLLNVMSQMEFLPIGSTISSRFRIRFRDGDGALWVLRYFGETETCGTDMPTALVNATRTSATEWTNFAPAGSVAGRVDTRTAHGRG